VRSLLAAVLAVVVILAIPTSGAMVPTHASAAAPALQAQAALARPTSQQLAWHDLELGMFIHLAPQTWQDSESDRMTIEPAAMNPEKLDTDQWVSVAEALGARYIVFVAKHEGGFCWWQTETTDFGVRNTPWRGGKGDVLKDLAESCRKKGIRLGVYLSPQDRKHGIGVGGRAKDPSGQAAYERLFHQQLTEVLSRYGEMTEVWFDGSLVFDVGDLLKRYAPNAVVFQGPQASIRWVGNEDGVAPYPAWNAVRFPKPGKEWGHYTAADGDPDGNRWLPNECDARIRATWFWHTDNAHTLKSVDQLMEMYYRSVGRGAVLLLNQTPDRTGLIPEGDGRRAAEFGAEIRRRLGSSRAETKGTGTELLLKLATPTLIDHVVTMEEIRDGERVRAYTVEGQIDGAWQQIASGTAIGHKKIDRVAPVRVTGVRLRVIDSTAAPRIRRLAVFGPGAQRRMAGLPKKVRAALGG
jgi:alpha-L-fucosidase